MGKLKDIWDPLKPEKKRRISVAVILLVLIGFAALAYQLRSGRKVETEVKRTTREVKLDEDQIEKGLYARTKEIQDEQTQKIDAQNLAISRQQKMVKQMQEAIEDLKNIKTRESKVSERATNDVKFPGPDKKTSTKDAPNNPADRSLSQMLSTANPAHHSVPVIRNTINKTGPPETQMGEIVLLGDIGIEKGGDVEGKDGDKTNDKKKVVETIYLPPSFMEATLLSGVTAQTTTVSSDDPLPLLFRINDLAVLPNRVKANLKGCFMIGEGIGRLSDERVHVRLLTLSCVDKKGSSVIDQAVKGWCVDGSDGKVGLKGIVTAKMGTHLARSLLAGFVGGIGEGVKTSTRDTSFNNFGYETSIMSSTDTKNIIKSGVGQGISTTAGELQKFYLQLAEQTLPVIEVGATKNCTLVVSEGVNLEIKEQHLSG
jgi:conjugal transfer pilus assembly protein TraB